MKKILNKPISFLLAIVLLLSSIGLVPTVLAVGATTEIKFGEAEGKVGDEVTVFGGKDGISLLEMARYCKTIPYEMLCMPAARIPRIYFKNGIAQ